jgi:hypothetical protein
MASKILKGLAVAAGTGLAIGFGSKRRSQAPSMSDASDNSPAIESPLDRLDRIEARMSAVEARPIFSIETLQVRMDQRFAEVAGEVPAMLESLVGPRVEDLRGRLLAEMWESVEATLASFEQTLDNKVSLRTSALEKALIDQSSTITTLGRRALEAEETFQRLISAVERLCQQKDRPVPELPFERQLTEAFQRQPGPSALPPDSGFRPRIVKEDDERPRHRTPLARL